MLPVEQFVHAVLSNKRMADLLAPQVNQIASILSNKGCQIIKQLTIDHNLIEVKPFRTCFNINRKMFVESPLPDDQVGNVTPRTYVSYTHEKDKMPYPKKFVEAIENSFEDPDEMLHFVKKYYQLLCHGEFPQKTKKLCLVGEINSGKTSLFVSFQGKKN